MKNLHIGKSKGFTIIELMIGVAVLAIFATLLINFGSQFFSGPKYKDMVNTHTDVVNGILQQYGYRPFFESAGSTSNLDTDLVIDLDMIDSDRVRTVGSAQVVSTGFEQSYWSISTTSSSPNRFTMTYDGVPSAGCTEFLPSVAGRATEIRVTPVIGGTAGTQRIVKSAANAPVSVGNLALGCKDADTVTMLFTYSN